MCYDKLESGILVLHKEDLTPLPFLQECFNGFRAEAQERGVTLRFNASSGNNVRLTPFSPLVSDFFQIRIQLFLTVQKYGTDAPSKNAVKKRPFHVFAQ